MRYSVNRAPYGDMAPVAGNGRSRMNNDMRHVKLITQDEE